MWPSVAAGCGGGHRFDVNAMLHPSTNQQWVEGQPPARGGEGRAQHPDGGYEVPPPRCPNPCGIFWRGRKRAQHHLLSPHPTQARHRVSPVLPETPISPIAPGCASLLWKGGGLGWTGAARAVPSGGRRCETAADGRRCSPGTRRSRAAAANPHRGDPHPKPPPLRAAGKARPRLARRWGWGWLCALGAALPRDGSTQRSRVTEQICDDQTTVESGQERNTRLGRVHQRRSSPTGAVPIGESGAQRDPCAVAPRLSTGRWEGTCFSTDGAATHRPVTAAGEHARLRTAARLLPALMTWPPCPHLSPQLRLSSPTAPLMGRDWGGGVRRDLGSEAKPGAAGGCGVSQRERCSAGDAVTLSNVGS